MSTRKQIKANKINGLKGGVKTSDGKKRIRFNAVKHGILGKFITEYDSVDSKEILALFQGEFSPQGIIEHILVEQLALLYLRMCRAARAEAEFIESQFHNGFIKLDFSDHEPKISIDAMTKCSELYARYETNLENRFFKTLEKLQTPQDGFVSQKGQV